MAQRRNVLITGVGSGIGAALARECLRRGDSVFAIGRMLHSSLRSPNLRFESQDLRVLSDIGAVVARLVQGVSSLDLVVLNAGALGELKDVGETSLSEISDLMDLNVWANKVLLDALFERVAGVSQVIGMSSGAAVSGNRGWAGYALSKATFLMLLKLYAAERQETHFCSFAPGLVDTAMQDYLCALPATVTERFPTVATIQSKRHTEDMPNPDDIAPRLLDRFAAVTAQASGAFVDIRKM